MIGTSMFNELQDSASEPKLVVNAGCGPSAVITRSSLFQGWRQVRVDIDPMAQPDIIADITDLSPLDDGIADAVWSSHCLEHLFQHQVSGALAEFYRVVADDGFVICLVPDLQAIANMIASDKFKEPIYNAPAGPVNAHDMVYGYGPAIAAGHVSMAHRCGFTPSILMDVLHEASFAEYAIRRLPTLELAIVARKTKGGPGSSCEALLQALAL